jgi:hypothetical protein
MLPVLFLFSSLIESAKNSLQILAFLPMVDQDPKPGFFRKKLTKNANIFDYRPLLWTSR